MGPKTSSNKRPSSSSPKARTGAKKIKTNRRAEAGEGLEKVDILKDSPKYQGLLAPVEVTQESTLALLERFNLVTDRIEQTNQDGDLELDFILQRSVLDERKYETAVESSGAGTWVMSVRYKPAPKKAYVEIMRIQIPETHYTEYECKTVVDTAARFCERWPFPINDTDRRLKDYLVVSFTHQAFPSKGYHIGIVKQGGDQYRLLVNLISPNSGKTKVATNTLAWTDFQTLVKPIPTVPKYVTRFVDRNVGVVDTPGKKNTFSFTRFIAWRFQNKTLSRTSFKQILNELQEEYTIDGDYGVDDDKDESTGIFYDASDSRSGLMSLIPTRYFSMKSDIGFRDIEVKSTSRSRAALVADAIDRSRDADPSDLLKAWKAGCRAADIISENVERGEPAPPQCTCQDEAERKLTMHRCPPCFMRVFCSTMLPDLQGELVCKDCAGKDGRSTV